MLCTYYLDSVVVVVYISLSVFGCSPHVGVLTLASWVVMYYNCH